MALSLLLLPSVSSAHKFPLEQGVQDSETLRMEIIENVVNPCYMNIAWGTGAEATMKLGEDAVMTQLKLDAHDEIEATVSSITKTVKDLSHPSSRMAIYMHAVEKCVAGTENDNIGEVVKQDITDAPEEKSPPPQVQADLSSSDDWARNEVIENIYKPCILTVADNQFPNLSHEKRQKLLKDGLASIEETIKRAAEGTRRSKDTLSDQMRKLAYAKSRLDCQDGLTRTLKTR